MLGYGRVTFVDLTSGKVREENLSDELALSFIGGKGLGLYYLYRMTDRYTDPLGPANPLILAIGPFTGTSVPYSGKAAFIFKSPQTGILGESVVGGTLGAFMRWAGLTALIITGRSSSPVYLYVDESGVEIKDASHLWGKGIYETEESLKKEHGKVSVASIGPAGENLVKFAAIGNEKWRQAGRTGAGAVMGSKKLKAIVVGASGINWDAHDPEGVREFTSSEIIPRAREAMASYFKSGTTALTSLANEMGFFPSYYWSKGSVDGWERIAWESLEKEVFVHPKGCFGCPTPCGRYSRSKRGGEVEIEYETVYSLGGLAAITDPHALVWLNDLIDDLGMDSITTGNVLAFAIEAKRRGLLDTELKLEYGDPEPLYELVKMIAFRQGIGDLLAEGVAGASRALGAEDLAVHVKGLEPAGYDPRTLKSMSLSYGVSSRGACHLRLMGYFADIKGLGGDRNAVTREKVEAVADLEEKGVLEDSLLLCKFTRTLISWPEMVKYFRLITGVNLSELQLKEAARRIITLSRMYNVRMGISRKDDRLPKRLLRESFRHKGEVRRITEEEMEKFLDMYYDLRGWDENGVPKREVVERYLPGLA